MHDCQKFREEWVSRGAGDGNGCEDCARFCQEARAVLQIMSAAAPANQEPTEEYWGTFEARLRQNLAFANTTAASTRARHRGMAALAAAAGIATVVTLAGLSTPRLTVREASSRIEFRKDHIEGLDPAVVDFLRQSELFLRSFTKIDPAYTADVHDARFTASRQLTTIQDHQGAAAGFPPVWIALREYESVLRDIRNLQSNEDLVDIKNRIERNGLIASLKAYQPRVVLVSRR